MIIKESLLSIADIYLGRFEWYRRKRKGGWYKHEFTKDAMQLRFIQGRTWWARYGEINRYSKVVKMEYYIDATADNVPYYRPKS